MLTQNGVSLVELLLLLVLTGIAAHTVATPVRHQADRFAVRAAREDVIALFAAARTHAREFGRAAVVVEDGTDPRVRAADGRELGRARISGRGVQIELVGSRTSASLEYGPMGVAGFASASLVLRKGEAEARIVVSSYGRVRR